MVKRLDSETIFSFIEPFDNIGYIIKIFLKGCKMSSKQPFIYNDMYADGLSLSDIQTIESVRNMERIDSLSGMIFDFPFELIERSSNEDKSIREIIKEDGIDYTQYIGKLRDYQTVGTCFLYYTKEKKLNGLLWL